MTILVCDDEPNTVRLLQVLFEGQGHHVVTAIDGRDCLEKLETSMPDLCVLDGMMPRMNGYEVLRVIRSNPEMEQVPVILLTANPQDRATFDGYHEGADLVLTKPFNPRELVAFL